MKKVIAILVCLSLIICFIPVKRASADALTVSIVSGVAAAISNSWGINFTASVASASGVESYFNQQVNEYINYNGVSITDLFGSEIPRIVAGRLAIAQTMYNGVINFIDWLINKLGLSGSDSVMTYGQIDGTFLPTDWVMVGSEEEQPSYAGYSVIYENKAKDYNNRDGYKNLKLEYEGQTAYQRGPATNPLFSGMYRFYVTYVNQTFKLYFAYKMTNDTQSQIALGTYALINDGLIWNGENYVEPTVLNPDKEWQGTIGGQAIPDTNLDDLIDDIFQDVADNNLDVEGEIVDVAPVPTPAPTWEPVSDVIDGINSLGEEITSLGNDIGNIANDLDDLGNVVGGLDDSIADQTGALGDAIEDQTGALGDAISDQTGALGDALADQTDSLNDSIDSVTDAVDSMADSIADVLDIPAAEDITARKWSLSTLFPFCIPFDIYNMLRAFDGVAQAPHVQLPFNIQSIGFRYMIDLDFSGFDPVAAVLRQVELIVYGIALAYATSKVIRW